MNKATPVIVFAVVVLASAGIFWYANKTTPQPDPNVLIVGTNTDYPPFSFIDHDAITGFDIELAQEVGKRLGKTIKLVDMPFDALLPKLQLGDLHMIAAGLTATPERAEKILFTKPYLEGDPLLIITSSKNPVAATINDLKDKAVVVNEGFTADLYLSKFQGPIIKRLATVAEAFMALKSEQAYAFVTAQSAVAPYFVQHNQEEFHIMPIEGATDQYSFAISKKHPELLPVIQQALDALEQDGTLDKLKQKWGLA